MRLNLRSLGNRNSVKRVNLNHNRRIPSQVNRLTGCCTPGIPSELFCRNTEIDRIHSCIQVIFEQIFIQKTSIFIGPL